MKIKSVFAGAAAGAVLAAGAIVALDQGSERADAQGGSSQFVTKAEFNAANKSANQRASAAINGYKIANNAITKFFIPKDDLIGAGSGPITQQRGTGANGLPGSTIQNGAIARAKIANEAVNSEKIAPGGVTNGDLANEAVNSEKIAPNGVTSGDLADSSVINAKIGAGAVSTAKIGDSAVTLAKLGPGQKQHWAQVQTGIPPTVVAQSDPAGGVTAQRVNAGNYRVNFGADISACSFTASVAFDIGATAAISAQVSPDVTNNQQVAVRTVASPNVATDASFQVQVLC